jgi:hypothetical protein
MSNETKRCLHEKAGGLERENSAAVRRVWTTPTVIIGSASEDTENAGGGHTDTHANS